MWSRKEYFYEYSLIKYKDYYSGLNINCNFTVINAMWGCVFLSVKSVDPIIDDQFYSVLQDSFFVTSFAVLTAYSPSLLSVSACWIYTEWNKRGSFGDFCSYVYTPEYVFSAHPITQYKYQMHNSTVPR